MKPWRHIRDLLAYLAPEPSLLSTRKHIAVITVLLAVAAIAGAVVLTPSHRRDKPDALALLRQHVSERAQVDLYDDFSRGLDAWETGGKLVNHWSYDKSGFVNPGSLSLYQPSMSLTNYDLDALVQIQSKGLGLAFRAASSQNYQVARLIVDGSGPMPALEVERYALISGRVSRPVRVKYPKRFQSDTLYQVHLQVRSDEFALYIQGELVDYWSDTRLRAGGVGLFCTADQHARVAWIRVSNHTDSLGRMCSWLSSIWGSSGLQ